MLLPACWMDVISNLICDESLFHAKMYKIFADILICRYIKPRFPKGKKAKHRAAGAEGGPSASASVDIDSMLNPELAAERRARQRHGQLRDGDDAKGGAADIKGFEVRYNVCSASPLGSPPLCYCQLLVLGIQKYRKFEVSFDV